jgi:hypothetical protein
MTPRPSTGERDAGSNEGLGGAPEQQPTTDPLSVVEQKRATAGLAADEDPSLGLLGVAALRHMADALERYQVQRARQAGFTWAEIGAALGVSAQAVHKKHARRLGG